MVRVNILTLNMRFLRKFSVFPKSQQDFHSLRTLFSRKKGFLIDCDGVLYHGNELLPGADQFVSFLRRREFSYLYLTNASAKSANQLAKRLSNLGIQEVGSRFFSSLDSTASYLSTHFPSSSCFVLGETALEEALASKGLYLVNDIDAIENVPDFVVVGETQNDEIYNFTRLQLACSLVQKGSKLIGTNIDVADRIGNLLIAGTGALVTPIEAVTGKKAFFPGKPNPLMANAGISSISLDKEDCVVIGDRMDTDIQMAVESGITSILLLSGVSRLEDLQRYSFQPTVILSSIGDVPRLFS